MVGDVWPRSRPRELTGRAEGEGSAPKVSQTRYVGPARSSGARAAPMEPCQGVGLTLSSYFSILHSGVPRATQTSLRGQWGYRQ